MKKKSLIIFLCILFLAGFLRLWQLGSIPASPDWDEAALGYNAYSLLKTGKDEYGTRFPLVFRSFDDYKPPLYVYLTIPSVAVFGLKTWAVRLPSVIFGLLAVIGTYFLTKELFKNKSLGTHHSLLATALLAISPWHIQFSRIAFEANTGVTLNIWGAYLFLRGLKNKSYLILSSIVFGLSLYAYHSERIFAPLLVLILVLTYRKELFTHSKKTIGVVVATGLLVVLPLIPVVFSPTSVTRLKGTSSTADQTGTLARSVKKLEDDAQAGNTWGIVFDNRRLVWAKTYFDGYISHFNPVWLFINGDNPRHHAPDMGMLYLWELPFLLIGLYVVFHAREKYRSVLYGWILASPVAASLTTELPHGIRTLVFLPSFQIITAVGIVHVVNNVKNQLVNSKNTNQQTNKSRKQINYNLQPTTYNLKKSIAILLTTSYLLLICFDISRYLSLYFEHYNREYSQWWQHGREEAALYAESVKDSYDQIVVSTELEQPHMFFLYFLAYDPVKYLEEGGTASGGFAEYRNKFDKFIFREIHWDNEIHDGSVLYIGLPDEIRASSIKTIQYVDGSDAIRIAH